MSTESLKTYEESVCFASQPAPAKSVSIPSVALGMMGLRLAAKRYFGFYVPAGFWTGDPPSRNCICPTCRAYIGIIDRISRGEAP